MPTATRPALGPRKKPRQERSAATVDAILEATIQVLLAVGKEQLTTTQVAMRAGVSVGTLYQYFPNKGALLQACLRRHMAEVSEAVKGACERYLSASLREMGSGLIDAYLGAKMRDVKTSAALYAVSSDIEGQAIAKAATAETLQSVAALVRSAQESLAKDPTVVASVVLAALNGISRRILESPSPEQTMESLRDELLVLVHGYLSTCVVAEK